jgi:hypothetical protein
VNILASFSLHSLTYNVFNSKLVLLCSEQYGYQTVSKVEEATETRRMLEQRFQNSKI